MTRVLTLLFFVLSLSIVIGQRQSIAASSLQLELKTTLNYRNSDQFKFPVSFPFPPEDLPVGDSTAFLATVDQGKHLELSNISVKGAWKINSDFSLLFKVDAIDLYDRNPTSQDHKIDADIFMLRYGRKASIKRPAKSDSYYVQVGKFEKFERQNDRHLQSYGLVSTAFNRFEDAGIEVGLDLNSQFYVKASITTGSPLFMRDPNALAGDNGTDDRRAPPNNPDPKLKSGVVILYDAEIEHFNLNKNPELGLALGYRMQGKKKSWQSNFMIWGYQRNLAQERNLYGTFYGADLDLLDGVAGFSLPIQGNNKQDIGFNYWLYWQEFTLFAQYVDQDAAGLNRIGKELELSYQIALPFNFSVAGKPLIKNITPVFRYSSLNTDFSGDGGFPAPSLAWDWQKYDFGVNIDFPYHLKLTLEYNKNDFATKLGTKHNDESLVSLNWRLRW